MTYTLDWLLETTANGEHPDYLFFWGHQPGKNGQLTAACFSQWWASPFAVGGVQYKTAEHWMMAQKARLFSDEDVFERVINARSPGAAKALGRQVRGFDDGLWREKRTEIVVQGSVHKFGQHPALNEFLQNTHDRVLVEASPVDSIWGIGLAADNALAQEPRTWQGLNLLGFALMETRAILANQLPLQAQ